MIRKTFHCIDGHTCGNPVRLVTQGAPDLKGRTMAEKRMHFMEEYDWIRKGLMFEPRGHDLMSGSFLYPPSDPSNDSGILFMETSGCLPMCGHGTIGTVTFMLEKELVTPKTQGILNLEVPAGNISAAYTMTNGKVKSVKIVNVPSFMAKEGIELDVPGMGKIVLDVSYGGNFYAIIEVQKNYPGLDDFSVAQILHYSPMIRDYINRHYEFIHPEDNNIRGLSHVMWTGKTIDPNSSGRNAVFYGDHAIDRSPCGTGTSARMAQRFSKGELKAGERFIHESIIGSIFIGTIEDQTMVGDYSAIVPGIEGWAMITSENSITIDEYEDPYAFGFQVN